jgi:hypothetical protein
LGVFYVNNLEIVYRRRVRPTMGRMATTFPETDHSFEIEEDRHGRPRAVDLRREDADAAARRVFDPVQP